MHIGTGYVGRHPFIGIGTVQDVRCLQTSHFAVRYLCIIAPVADGRTCNPLHRLYCYTFLYYYYLK